MLSRRRPLGGTSIGSQRYDGGDSTWARTERRSYLKEASDLNQLVVAAKTRESMRER
jgi:hypothetical protein